MQIVQDKKAKFVAHSHFHAEGEISFKAIIFVPGVSTYNNEAARFTENLKVLSKYFFTGLGYGPAKLLFLLLSYGIGADCSEFLAFKRNIYPCS